MRKLFFTLIILCCLSFTSCYEQKYSTHYFDYFDTVISFDGYFASSSEFNRACEIVESTLKEYDAIFDIHDESSELAILNEEKTLAVSSALFDALNFGIKAEKATEGYCNIALGSVVTLWHEARMSKEPYLPEIEALAVAAKHTDINSVQLINGTANITDENLSLDMGAIAKGYVSDILRDRLTQEGFDNLYINMGGNVMAIGSKDGNGWAVGIQSPDNEYAIAEAVSVSDTNLITSGSYQRYFEINGKKYHHIISSDTLQPSELYTSVSVMYENGAWADALSTALFNMSIEDGERILAQFDGIGVIWITPEGEIHRYGALK